jgi:hypothetical protein
VPHHRHFVQRRLAVEDDHVIVGEVPLDLVAAQRGRKNER